MKRGFKVSGDVFLAQRKRISELEKQLNKPDEDMPGVGHVVSQGKGWLISFTTTPDCPDNVQQALALMAALAIKMFENEK